MQKKGLVGALLCLILLFSLGCSENASYSVTQTESEITTDNEAAYKSDTETAVSAEATYSVAETETEAVPETETETVTKAETKTEIRSETKTETPTEKATEKTESDRFTDIHMVDGSSTYVAFGKKLFNFSSGDPNYYIVQGGCFDGEQYYIAVIKKLSDGYEKTRILVLDPKGNLIRESGELDLDHANSITYNERLDRLVVAHCHSPDGHYYRYSMLDPVTLTVTETADKDYPFYAMAYSPERDMYASGEWSGEAIDIWNGDMDHLRYFSVKTPGSLSQGVFCDDEGIYFVRSEQNGYPAEIRIYNWKAKLQATVELKLKDGFEPESISVVDGYVYIAGTDWTVRRGSVYRLYFEPVE